MAEERTLGLARAHEQTTEEPSKEELQRRLDHARDSITHTVTEIKETVANQVQAVKDTLDWREQFKKRPVVWSATALGVGFATGYCIANYVKGDESDYHSAIDRYGEESRYYAPQGMVSGAAMATPGGPRTRQDNGSHDDGPNFFQKIANTHAFERVKDEAGNIGDAVVQELSKVAKTVVVPALMTSLRNFIGDYLPNAEKQSAQGSATQRDQSRPATSAYQPSLERNPS
jgi:predicted small metal-binding protein